LFDKKRKVTADMSTHSKIPSGLGARRDQTYQEKEHDTYKLKGKLKEPTVCTECGALFHNGRWTWNQKPAGADEIICPACLRIRDKYAKGFLTLSGSFLTEHKEEIMGVVHNTEAKEKTEHPLSRVMGYEQQAAALMISTTDTHLPRRIGEALHHAYQGELKVHYDEGEEFIRVAWTR
jgi:NMD protein affecting ribosome stability and mRNA decay